MENDTLDGWVEKYKHYSSYPVVGKVSPTLLSRSTQQANCKEVACSRIDTNSPFCRTVVTAFGKIVNL